jgi:hypothetical protein
MESRQCWCPGKRTRRIYSRSYLRVQIQGQPVNSIRIDKYDVVEFRGEGSVEEWILPPAGGQRELCVLADLKRKINLLFPAIYKCGWWVNSRTAWCDASCSVTTELTKGVATLLLPLTENGLNFKCHTPIEQLLEDFRLPAFVGSFALWLAEGSVWPFKGCPYWG